MQAGLTPDPASIPALQSGTADLLRNEPSLSVEEAVARAYVRARRIEPAHAESLRRALRGENAMIPVQAAMPPSLSGKVEEQQRIEKFTRQMFEQLYVVDRSAASDFISADGFLFRESGDRLVMVGRRIELVPTGYVGHDDVFRNFDPSKHLLVFPGDSYQPTLSNEPPVQALPAGRWRIGPPAPDGWRAGLVRSSALSGAGSQGAALQQKPDGSIVRRGRSIFSAMISKLGALFPAPEAAKTPPTPADPWAELASVLGLDPARAPEWRRATAETLRHEPGLLLANALAESLGKTYPGSPFAGNVGESLFVRGEPVSVSGYRTFDVRESGGQLYFSSEGGLFRGRAGNWEQIFDGPVRSSLMFGGDLFVSTFAHGLIRVAPDGTFVRELKNGYGQLDVLDGELVLLTAGRPRIRRWGLWWRAWGWPDLIKILHADGRVFGFGDGKIYRRTWFGWIRVRPSEYMDSFEDAFAAGDRLYLVMARTLYRLEGGQRVQVSKKRLSDYFAVGDQIYALGGIGRFPDRQLYRLEGSRWIGTGAFISKPKGGLRLDGLDYVASETGLYVWPLERGASFQSALSRMLDALAGDAGRLSPPAAPSAGVSVKDGSIVSRGRAIFSSLVSKLGVGFGEPKADDWSALADWTRSLGVSLTQEEVRQWRDAAAEQMRQQPDQPLATVLADSLVRTARLAPELSKKAAWLFKAGRFPWYLPTDVPWVRDAVEHDGRLFVAAFDGIHQYDGAAWTRFGTFSEFLGVVDGKVYASSREELFSWDGKAWILEFNAGKPWERINTVSNAGGTLYAGTSHGLWTHSPDRGWRRTELRKKYVRDIREIGGKLYVGTDAGLYFREKKGWKHLGPEGSATVEFVTELDGKLVIALHRKGLYEFREYLPTKASPDRVPPLVWNDPDGFKYRAGEAKTSYWHPIGPVFRDSSPENMKLFEADGALHLASTEGLLRRDPSGWTRIIDPSDGTGGVRGILRTKGYGELLVTENGLWKIASTSLYAGWQSRIVADLGGQMKAPEASNPVEDVSSDSSGAIRKGGRTIFSAILALLGR
jgi:hypothetical protein